MNLSSKIFKELTKNEIESLMDIHFPKREILQYFLMVGGAFNTTYSIEFTDGYKIVLRVGPVNRHLILPFEINLMKAEEELYSIYEENSIPTSKLLACNTMKDIIERDYIIVEHLDCIPMTNQSITEEEKAYLYEKAGEYAAKIHQIEGDYFGFISNCFSGIKHKTWKEFIFRQVNDIKEKCREFNVFDFDFLKRCEEQYYENQPIFDFTVTPYLVHYDLWDGNILIDYKDDMPYIKAIIDFDRSLYGDIDFDLATPWITNKFFYKGYNRPVNTHKNRKLKLELYCLLNNLMETCIYKVEYDNMKAYEDNAAIAKDRYQKVMLMSRKSVSSYTERGSRNSHQMP